MESFKQFVEQTKEQEKNLKDTIAKLPKKHQALIHGFKIKWHHDNTLDGDNKHIGLVNPNNNTITIAAPYRFSREFTFLHECGHLVWENFVSRNSKLINKWKEIVKNTKSKVNQNIEELFCHAYAATYAKNPPTTHYHINWIKFIKELPK